MKKTSKKDNDETDCMNCTTRCHGGGDDDGSEHDQTGNKTTTMMPKTAKKSKKEDDKLREIKQKLSDDDFRKMLDWIAYKRIEFNDFVQESRKKRLQPEADWLKRVREACAELG